MADSRIASCLSGRRALVGFLTGEIAKSPAPPQELGLTELSFQHRSPTPHCRSSSSQKLPSNGSEKPKSGGNTKGPDLSFVLKEKAHTYVSDSEAYENKENHNSANFSMPPGFAQLVQNEVQKLMKSKGKMNRGDDGTSSSPTPLANFSGFAGTIFPSIFNANMNINSFSTSVFTSDFPYWIIDTGATSHMSSHLTQFTHYKSTNSNNMVHLPDGSKSIIKHVGLVTIGPNFTLQNVLHIPTFTHNLLSVGRLILDSKLVIKFLSNVCLF
ncbi:uncharacterized protein [Euphorbia lathyris]|uniref:uncharacterized protein n=1 Tax=Euphorbia lathyris TaxID=212925 RepID=UPI0033137D5D